MKKDAKLSLNRISSDAVRKATGHTWEEWLDRLDRDEARAMTHTEMAKHLVERYELAPWWSQSVAVGYEQARGLRLKHEKKDGFEISVSRTYDVPAAAVFTAFFDPPKRASWCHERSYNVRSSNRPASLRIAWPDGSSVVVAITRKGNSRSSVTVQHGKLPDADAAAKAKQDWATSLDRLRAMLDG